jgi:hypothetical protein
MVDDCEIQALIESQENINSKRMHESIFECWRLEHNSQGGQKK